jgi:hypothetical protein
MKLGLAGKSDSDPCSVLKVEAALTGQTFYILEKSPSPIVPSIITDYDKAIDALRSRSAKFFITDSQGKAEIDGLKSATYYICGVSKTQWKIAVWNVQINLKPGQNSLVLDSSNMMGKQKI